MALAPPVIAVFPTSPIVSIGLSPVTPLVFVGVAVWFTLSLPPASAL